MAAFEAAKAANWLNRDREEHSQEQDNWYDDEKEGNRGRKIVSLNSSSRTSVYWPCNIVDKQPEHNPRQERERDSSDDSEHDQTGDPPFQTWSHDTDLCRF